MARLDILCFSPMRVAVGSVPVVGQNLISLLPTPYPLERGISWRHYIFMTGPWSLLKLSNIAHPWTPPGGKKIPERALELLGNRVQGPSSYLSWQRPRNSQQHPTNRIRFHSVLVFPFRLFIKSQNTKWGKDLLYYINIWLRAGGGMWLLCNFHQESPAPPP